MGRKRDLVEEIIAVRRRRRFDNAQAEVFVRLSDIDAAFQKRDPKSPETLKYFPIALVACIESAFRLLIRELIDFGSPYLDRGVGLAENLKFDYAVVQAFHGKTISIGDFIAHTVRINNINDIQKHMTELLGKDFLVTLGNVYDRVAVEVHREAKKPILSDAQTVYRSVARTFELRHVFCHELASSYEFTDDEIAGCVNAARLFINASIELHTQTLFPNAPLCQRDMNIQAAKDLHKAEEELEGANTELTTLLNKKRGAEYLRVHKAWIRYRNLLSEFQANEYKGGTIWPTIYGMTAQEETQRRFAEVKKVLEEKRNFGDGA